MVYDPNASADLMLPGTNGSGCTYVYTGGDWDCAVYWNPGLIALSLAWDDAIYHAIEFGGENAATHAADNSTWRSVGATGQWTELDPGSSPSARWGAGLAWDPSDE